MREAGRMDIPDHLRSAAVLWLRPVGSKVVLETWAGCEFMMRAKKQG